MPYYPFRSRLPAAQARQPRLPPPIGSRGKAEDGEMRMEAKFEITEGLVTDLLGVVDAGLVDGVGKPEPGKMCVEAAVCYAMGLPHSDRPTCVSPALRELVIRLNDSSWSSKDARAKGLRRLAVAQLGSADVLDENEFIRRVVDLAIRKQVPIALRAAAKIHPDSHHNAKLLDAATRCEEEGTEGAAADAAAAAAAAASAAVYDAAYAAYAAAADARDALVARDSRDAAYATASAAACAASAAADARDKHLSEFAEDVVQVLIEMNVPGTEWLVLTEAA